MDPVDYRPYLSPSLNRYLQDCCLAGGKGEHLTAAIWGAASVEAWLDQAARDFNLPKASRDDFNGRIQQLRNFVKKEASPSIPDAVIHRCDEVRLTRNRLVHDMGLAGGDPETDARSIMGHIHYILDWYRGVRKEEGRETASNGGETDPPPIRARVFISRATPHTPAQRLFLSSLKDRLRRIGIKPVECELTEYDKKDPIRKVSEDIAGCDAMIVLGLERSHAYFLCDKEGGHPHEQEETTHRRYTSGWLHLEAGVANAKGIEVFPLCHKDIHGDGIFDRRYNSYVVTELPSLDEDSPELAEFLNHLSKYLSEREGAGSSAA